MGKILTELQNNILQVKAQPENKPLPVFLEKLLRRILDSDDLEGFRRFSIHLPNIYLRSLLT